MTRTSEPQVSVALVTRNRLESLRRTLESLRAQARQPFEVVLSDDSDALIQPEIEQAAHEFKCRYIVGPKRGLYANRNHVAAACNGTHIRTMDDDHEFPYGHIEAVQEAVTSSPNDILVIPEKTNHDGFLALHPPSQLGPSGYGYPPSDPGNCWSIADGCTVYPAGIFRSGILMMEEWPFGQAYLEFGARLRFLHGVRSRFSTNTYVNHHHEPGLRQSNFRLIEGASAVCAALLFSWSYQPRLANKIATIERLAILLLKRGVCGWKSIRWGANVFLAERNRREPRTVRCGGYV